jgi:predicted MFS family arabinose efflux permease
MNVVTSSAVSIYIPCLKFMAVDLDTTNSMLQISIVIHLIGEFLGRFLGGPLINATGNIKKILLPAIALSALGHFGCFLSTSIYVFFAMRFIQSIGASIIYIASVEIIHAEFNEKEKSSITGILELYQPIAWILSPFVGCALAVIGSWRLSFFVLMLMQIFGLMVFKLYNEKNSTKLKKRISVSRIFRDYRSVICNSYFLIYALIPGLFAGGYMIFASNSPFICFHVFGNHSADVALFQAIPLLFYVAATFVYRSITYRFSIKLAKRMGIGIYIIFGMYTALLISEHDSCTANHLLAIMCIQCIGSAFIVPVSVIKAIQSAELVSVGASTVVVFRNIIMSFCIALGAKLSENITMIMGCVFMTVASVVVLIATRRIIKVRTRHRRQKDGIAL